MSLQIVGVEKETPVVWCLVCGEGFGASKLGRPYEEHVASCSEDHDAELRHLSLRQRAPHLFDPQIAGDVELGAWIRANRAAIFHRQLKI